MAIKTCRRGTFMYNVNDAFIGRSLDLYGEWCDDEIHVASQILTEGAVVLDVGANIGTHTVGFARSVGPRGLVIALEPQRLVYQTLCGNVALNGLTNVSTMLAAAGATRGEVIMPSLDPRATQNFGAVKAQTQGQGEMADVIPVDELGLRRCALIKVDVEGMEAQVVEGARKTIERCRPALFLENDTVEGSRAVITAVESVGYKAFWHIASYFNPRNFFGNPDNVFAQYQPQGNMLCVPRECPFTGLMPVEGVDDDWKKAVARMLRVRPEAAPKAA
jgi:FkbM family methyltransferase